MSPLLLVNLLLSLLLLLLSPQVAQRPNPPAQCALLGHTHQALAHSHGEHQP
jgi:hypothetical protein